jgi:hypothetical protein
MPAPYSFVASMPIHDAAHLRWSQNIDVAEFAYEIGGATAREPAQDGWAFYKNGHSQARQVEAMTPRGENTAKNFGREGLSQKFTENQPH